MIPLPTWLRCPLHATLVRHGYACEVCLEESRKTAAAGGKLIKIGRAGNTPALRPERLEDVEGRVIQDAEGGAA